MRPPLPALRFGSGYAAAIFPAIFGGIGLIGVIKLKGLLLTWPLWPVTKSSDIGEAIKNRRAPPPYV